MSVFEKHLAILKIIQYRDKGSYVPTPKDHHLVPLKLDPIMTTRAQILVTVIKVDPGSNISTVSLDIEKAKKINVEDAYIGENLRDKDKKEIIPNMIKSYQDDLELIELDRIPSNVTKAGIVTNYLSSTF